MATLCSPTAEAPPGGPLSGRHVPRPIDVLWGFLVALGIVLVLTPAVGRVARVLGVVDEPGESSACTCAPLPRLGGLAIFLGIFVPALAFLDLTRRLPRHPARRRRGDGRRHGRRLPRPPVVAQARRPGRSPPGSPIHFGVYIDHFSFPSRRPRPAVLVLGGRHRRLDRRDDERDQPPRRHGRARRGDLRDRRGDVRRPRALARPARGRRALGDRRRRVPRLPAPQLLSGADLHG